MGVLKVGEKTEIPLTSSFAYIKLLQIIVKSSRIKDC